MYVSFLRDVLEPINYFCSKPRFIANSALKGLQPEARKSLWLEEIRETRSRSSTPGTVCQGSSPASRGGYR